MVLSGATSGADDCRLDLFEPGIRESSPDAFQFGKVSVDVLPLEPLQPIDPHLQRRAAEFPTKSGRPRLSWPQMDVQHLRVELRDRNHDCLVRRTLDDSSDPGVLTDGPGYDERVGPEKLEIGLEQFERIPQIIHFACVVPVRLTLYADREFADVG